MERTDIQLIDVSALAMYASINTLFVYKYTHRLTPQSWVISLLYLVAVSLVVLLLTRKTELSINLRTRNIVYFSTIGILAALFIILMLQFDPQKIRVGRYPALHDWISRFLHSEFPYGGETNPSGFPFLFVIAMPFYFLGDLGFLQIFSFLIFAFLVYLRNRDDSTNGLRLIFLLASAPIFLYEVAVRSDLISNMVLVILYMAAFESVTDKTSRFTSSLWGLLGGLLLSTRGIVLLIYVPFLGYYLGRRFKNSCWFFLSLLIGFLLTLLPFLIWNWRLFWDFGPFARQLTQIPKAGVILSAAGSVYCAVKVRSPVGIYSAVSLVLFGVAGIAFLLAVTRLGWYEAVLKDGFDISYFSFTLPFLLISLDLSRKGKIAVGDRVFSSEQREPK